jgi:FtsP/CotA-like multicopper oxidase with cupredoxin domain
VEKGGRVRLRIINAAASTNFWIVLGDLPGELVAVDGNAIVPVDVGHVPLAMAQRADIVVMIPSDGGSWPVLALREGGTERTGLVLATKDGHVHRISSSGDKKAGPLHAHFESHLEARDPLPKRKPDRMIHLVLTGGMNPYVWGINGKPSGEHEILRPKPGERLRLMFENRTGMSHPMHLHGHHFQITALNGQNLTGALRDTVLVPASGGTVAADLDAGHGGRWLLHCHNAYHMGSGMMAELRYGV